MADEKAKVCPMAPSRVHDCSQERCAWWVSEDSMCVIVKISASLYDMANMMHCIDDVMRRR